MDEKYLEQASRLEQNQRDANVRDVRARLQGVGQDDCVLCGEPIPHDRRRAMPSAIRCIPCQSGFERLKGLGL